MISKIALSALDLDTPPEEAPVERVLPSDVKFAIAEEKENTVILNSEEGVEFAEAEDYEYELDHLSLDYQSMTNSDYMKVVDDVKQFKDVVDPENPEPVILVTDDESASVNSVLVIETHSIDAWEFSETESQSQTVGDFNFDQKHGNDEGFDQDDDVEPDTLEEFKAGNPLTGA